MSEEQQGWGWWTVYEKLDDYERTTLRAICPSPGATPLLDIGREYTATELADLLQHFGSYLASIHYQEAMLGSKVHALKESYRTGMQVAMARQDTKSKSVGAAEGEILASNDQFSNLRKMQIEAEAALILVKGWIESYEAAYNTISRLITLHGVDVSLATGRHA